MLDIIVIFYSYFPICQSDKNINNTVYYFYFCFNYAIKTNKNRLKRINIVSKFISMLNFVLEDNLIHFCVNNAYFTV